MKQFIVVSYDISDDRRRTKVMKTLKNFGAHIQYSVFECRLQPKEFAELKHKLSRLISKQDTLRFYFISDDDVSRIQTLGFGEVTEERMFFMH
jgi:CRISPR-associated protein Cas2